jgi:hypothetical protein
MDGKRYEKKWLTALYRVNPNGSACLAERIEFSNQQFNGQWNHVFSQLSHPPEYSQRHTEACDKWMMNTSHHD